MNNREAAYEHFMRQEMRISSAYSDVFYAGFDAALASQAQQDSQWKPIATAPKNKKIIVRYKNVCDNDRTVFAKYIEEFTEEANSETDCETDYHEERDTYYFKEGWVEMIDNWDEFSCVYFDSRNVPTHWMDIPPAPEGGNK